MLTGTLLQIAILLFIIVRMKWERQQAMLAAARITKWGGKNEDRELMASMHINDHMGPVNSEN
ncbi:hypothetical protein BAE44_0002852 [Dichanthelium oligosanthes]|uniref:Uncharacterized protein n=1 Tax=Dichanthelium oligosanthes TaxID=888268 RepID=A0A1E5WFD8_9POAL|nr:hypothetical protein BAE44_0002852 [Dichanthelium oligosanthes]